MPINPATMLKHKKQVSEARFARRMHEAQHNVTPKYHVQIGENVVSDKPVTMRELFASGIKLTREVKLIPA